MMIMTMMIGTIKKSMILTNDDNHDNDYRDANDSSDSDHNNDADNGNDYVAYNYEKAWFLLD